MFFIHVWKWWNKITKPDSKKWFYSLGRYTDNVAYVRIGNELSHPIEVIKGLKKGCSISPILFNIYLKKTLDRWKNSCLGMGVPIEENEFLFSFNYVEDQVIIPQDADDL